MQDKTLQGSVLVLVESDVSEEIRLDDLRDIFGARRQEASFKHPTPGYVRYQRPPGPCPSTGSHRPPTKSSWSGWCAASPRSPPPSCGCPWCTAPATRCIASMGF